MIPKVIHYCWFGGAPLPDIAHRCIESWERECPDYKLKLWNESNFDIQACPYVIEAYDAKRWAFVSDYARLKIIYENGGIYLDTDVEILKSLDSLLDNGCFLGTEESDKEGYINTGLGFGAEKKHYIVKKMLEEYEGIHFKISDVMYDTLPCPRRNTRPLLHAGFRYTPDLIWSGENVSVYPPEFFSPMSYVTGELRVTEKSYSIHHYAALWKSTEELDVEKKIEQLNKKNPITYFIAKQWIQYRGTLSPLKPKNFITYMLGKIRVRAMRKWSGK